MFGGKVDLKVKANSAGPFSLEVGDAFFGFVDAGTMALRDPPECRVGAGEFVEPVVALAEEFGVHRVVDVVLQSCDIFPDRHVEQNAIVVAVGAEVGGVAFAGLQARRKARPSGRRGRSVRRGDS